MRTRVLSLGALLFASVALACGSGEGAPAASLAEKRAEVAADTGATAGAKAPTGAQDEVAGEAKERYESFEFESPMLSEFAGKPVSILGTVLIPPGHNASDRAPVNYVVHGFGGSNKTGAMMHGARYAALEKEGVGGPMLHVFLDANHPMGHHVFADSANTGPWGTALVEEYIPALEKKYGGAGVPWGRFVSGHSSGGWSSLWLQVAYPDTFGGVWSTSPDPVDFRDFTGTDIYSFDNMYKNPQGEPTMLMRRGEEFVRSFESFTRKEVKTQPVGGQIYSFDAVFSPRLEQGGPAFLFDRETGAIDPNIAQAWRAYDIRQKIEREWPALEAKLAGKLNIFVGTWDTFRLEGAVKLLDTQLKALGSDATVVFVDKRDHFDLGDADPTHFPKGLKTRVLEEMWATWEAGEASAKAAAQ